MHFRGSRGVAVWCSSGLLAAALSAVMLVAGAGPAGAVEGSWAATGALNEARIAHKSTLLTNGRVLVSGGRSATAALTSAELYNPITELFSLTGSMATSRWSHTATLLPNGQVLVTGGFTGFVSGSNSQAVTNTAELYNPNTGTWAPTGSMGTRRALHTATLLANGKVLVAGGRTCNAPPPATCDFTFRTNTAELYDPATGTFTPTGSMTGFRHTTSAVRLQNGKVLVPAGFGAPDPHDTSNTADLYDPATGTWSLTGNLNISRARQGAMLLPDGTVLVGPGSRSTTCGPPVCPTGGPPFSAVIVETSETYNPATNTWQLTTGKPLLPGRFNFQQAVLPNGTALMAGGFGGPAGAEAAQRSAEVYHPATGLWSSAGDMTRVHGSSSALANTHDAVVLSASTTSFVSNSAVCGSNCGKVLVVGDNLTDPVADLYTPAPRDTTPPTCFVSAVRNGPPRQMDVTVQDAGNGLAFITNIVVTNGTVATNPSPIPPGAPTVVVTATKTDPNQLTRWSFDAVDLDGNIRRCT